MATKDTWYAEWAFTNSDCVLCRSSYDHALTPYPVGFRQPWYLMGVYRIRALFVNDYYNTNNLIHFSSFNATVRGRKTADDMMLIRESTVKPTTRSLCPRNHPMPRAWYTYGFYCMGTLNPERTLVKYLWLQRPTIHDLHVTTSHTLQHGKLDDKGYTPPLHYDRRVIFTACCYRQSRHCINAYCCPDERGYNIHKSRINHVYSSYSNPPSAFAWLVGKTMEDMDIDIICRGLEIAGLHIGIMYRRVINSRKGIG